MLPVPSSPVFTRLSALSIVLFGSIAGVQMVLGRLGWSGVMPGVTLVAAWWLLVVASEPLWLARRQVFGAHRRRLLRIIGFSALSVLSVLAVLFLAYLAWKQVRSGAVVLGGPSEAHARTAAVSTTMGFAVFFLRQVFGSTEVPTGRDPRHGYDLVLLALVLQAVASVVRFDGLAWDLGNLSGWFVSGLALFLPLEWALARALRFMRPPALRLAEPFSGYSLTARMIGDRSPVLTLASAIKETFGLEIRGSWLARSARLSLEPFLLILSLAWWFSTALVIVPPDSEAVRVTWGRFQPQTLGPGLHLTAPWPIEHVRIVPVGRIQEFALGFDEDLGGPVLWTQRHFEGESNLLVGNGEEVLTFNVPVHFDIADALAAERTSAHLGFLLSNLAQRELLIATAPRDSFGIMTNEREAVSTQIHHRLQAASSHFGLGARIRYVGLKDIHPPVEVTPAYQEVISAHEQRRTIIDLAAANRFTTLAEVHSEVFRLRRLADSFAVERIAAVTGETAMLVGKVTARSVNPELFDFHNRILVAEEVFPKMRVLLTDRRKVSEDTFTLDLREGSTTYP